MRDELAAYEAVIGLEIHAELATQSKMFCGCRVVDSVTAPPNTAVCPVCLGMPGMLPVVNRAAVDMALRVALALNCTIQPDNRFARKNYFYPDLPKSYQISQYELPLARHGWVDITTEAGPRRVRVRRVHLEEDTGKLTHVAENGRQFSLIDFNRACVPLLEIVSEPDMRSVAEARAYAVKVRQILRYLAVNSGDMEKGVIRFEANVSLRPHGSDTLGTRTEVKNLNSFRALTGAATYELTRQALRLAAGEAVEQATLGWDEARRVTISQRSKEDAHDYRYLPDPDLPPLAIGAAQIDAARATLPVLPAARHARYTAEWGLSSVDADVLVEEKAVADWFEAAVAAAGQPGAVANWIVNTLFNILNESDATIDELPLTPAALVDLIDRVAQGEISNSVAKTVLAEMVATGQSAAAVIKARGLAQISDNDALAAIIEQIMADNPAQVDRYLGGKEQLRGWFVGQVMGATRGQANPAVVNDLLTAAFAARR